MVQTRATAKRIESGKPNGNCGVLPQGTAVGPPLGLDGGPSPAKKRRQDGAESSKKRRRGKPSELCQLNLDVLFLIAAYVHPIDLLNLARTCKSLRELLMDKCSEFVWKVARPVGGLPDCPVDLTEPEYANLAFCTRCHGCGKYAKMILWKMRRRYCPDCRARRLLPFSSFHEIIGAYEVLAAEKLTIGKQTTYWVDREQMDSFMREYNHSSDKNQFLCDKQGQHTVVREHARKCIFWQDVVETRRKSDLESRREERETSIFERLEQHGYEPEIDFFGYRTIQESRKSLFKTPKPLTDREWARIWPEWLETMNKFRFKRLDKTVYKPRRDSLVSEYANYVTSPSPNTPAFDLLPPVTDLVHFPLLQDIIRAPMGTQMDDHPFESAFAQLPVLVDEWRQKFDAQLAELVKIPSPLSLKNASRRRAAASSKTTRTESSQLTGTGKLRLACAVFNTVSIFTYPEVLSTMRHCESLDDGEDDSECTVSIQSRFQVTLLEDAPYIIHACGLDPNVATAEDMDRRNARLVCLSCMHRHTGSWRDAMWHAHFYHRSGQASHSDSARWGIVNDEHTDAIEAAELCKKELRPEYTRCLLCRPCVGDAKLHKNTILHLNSHHRVASDDIKRGAHYVNLGMHESSSVEMVEEGEAGDAQGADP